jgi:primosomal protein N'
MTRPLNYYEVLLKSVPLPLTYQSKTEIPIGSLVSVALNKKSAQGIVLKRGKNQNFKCLDIEAVLIPEAVSPLQLELASWMSEYYFAPLPKCVALFVPPRNQS